MQQLEVTKREAIIRELTKLINRYSLENGSDTPDWILAEHMLRSLELFDLTIKARTRWYSDDR
jgi:hypothetical protein